jgi:hypothetical protein
MPVRIRGSVVIERSCAVQRRLEGREALTAVSVRRMSCPSGLLEPEREVQKILLHSRYRFLGKVAIVPRRA